MAKKITIRPGMSRHTIKRQIERAFKSAVDDLHWDWQCSHGHRHRIKIGNIRKGSRRRLWCGCYVEGR